MASFRFQIRDGDIISPRIEAVEPLKHQCRHFLESVRTGKRPVSSGVEGRDVVRVLEAVNRSIECKGLQVEVESKGDHVYANVDASKAASTLRLISALSTARSLPKSMRRRPE